MSVSNRSKNMRLFCEYCESRGDYALMLTMGKYINFEPLHTKTLCKFKDSDWMFFGDCKEMEDIDNINYTFRRFGIPEIWKSFSGILTEVQFEWVKEHSEYKGVLNFPLYKLMRDADVTELESFSNPKPPRR